MKPFSLRPDLRNGTALVRAAATHALAYIRSSNKNVYLDDDNVDRVLKQRWPADRDTELLVKAAVTPTTMAIADGLAPTSVPDFFVSMSPASAGADLLRQGVMLSFNGAAAISVPDVVSSAGSTSFVEEGKPIPHRQLTITPAILQPRKFATLMSFTRELFECSTPSIEGIVRTVLTESVGLNLDAAMFSATPADAGRPAGLLLGIAPTTPSPTTDHNQAMIEDVAKLASAVSVVASNGPIVFVCAPAQAVTLRLRTMLFPYTVLASSSLADKTVICIAPNALASATDPVPRFELEDKGTTMHTDTAPTDISTAGSPPVVAYPVISTFQSDRLSLRMIFEMSWALRSQSGLAWMQNVLW